MEHDFYQLDILQAKHFTQAVNVISKTFSNCEPMTSYLGITQENFKPFGESIVSQAIKDGLSIVAMHNGQIVACTIVEDLASPGEITIEIDSRFKIIFNLLEQLSGEFLRGKILFNGRIVHLFITAVAKEHFNNGLSKIINFESMKLAEQKGYDLMCCEFTHSFNEKGTVKNITGNKFLIKTINYQDFIYKGKKPFENLNGSASAYIWELKPQPSTSWKEREK